MESELTPSIHGSELSDGLARSVVTDIEHARGSGYSLLFSRTDRNMALATHWGMAGLTAVISILWFDAAHALDVSRIPVLSMVTLTVQIVVAVAVSVLATRAVRIESTYQDTDLWDNLTSMTQTAAVIVATVVLGGSHSPLWFVVVVGMTYIAMLAVGWRGYLAGACIASGVAVSAAANDQWVGSEISVTIAAMFGLPFAYFLCRHLAHQLYVTTEENVWEREVLRARVVELSGLLERAAAGDLSVAGGLSSVVAGDRFGD
ncbi:MAG TPA: hypothetical protein VMT88_10060, partial [Actinomycetes bacterium]|nr:hypothetical protein [Actinomycetes bacterium]